MLHRKPLAKTKNGFTISVDVETSHAATHLADTLQLLELIREIVQGLEPTEAYVEVEKNMGCTIGTSHLVEVEDGDDIVYVKRLNRDTYTPFAKNKKPIPTSWVTVKLQKIGEWEYDIATAYLGRNTPSLPDDPHETLESKSFWTVHALAWGTQKVVPSIETTKYPWETEARA